MRYLYPLASGDLDHIINIVGGKVDDKENFDYPHEVSEHDTKSEDEYKEDDHHEQVNSSVTSTL